MITSVGEILVDIFPGYRRIGGAPFNFAYHLQKIGEPVSLISRIGNDAAGREIMNLLDLNGFDTRHVMQDDRYETGRVTVTLDDEGTPTFEILGNMAYDHIDARDGVAAVRRQNPDLIYFGTLSQRTARGHGAVQKILAARDPEARVLCDVNLRPGCYNEKIVRESLQQCNALKMNTEELKTIKGMFRFPGSDDAFVDHLMQDMGIGLISLTKGAAGSELFTHTGSHEQRNTPVEIAGDTVGAGDAYASVVALGCTHGWTPEKIVETAAELARRVCGIKGAIPAEAGFYEGLLDPERKRPVEKR
ncbi:MAG: PfkB family carbohydrate kinase [Deltaproteobacteria bacterium]|jgi:fructokinase|nr:PfkB family carbohydrate kinase [Deltaproteobacteria bacterium]